MQLLRESYTSPPHRILTKAENLLEFRNLFPASQI